MSCAISQRFNTDSTSTQTMTQQSDCTRSLTLEIDETAQSNFTKLLTQSQKV